MCSHCGRDRSTHPNLIGRSVAPPEWQAAADAACERCDGSGKYTGNVRAARHLPCLYCRSTGRPVHELTVPCPNDCYPVGSGPCSACAQYPYGPGGPHKNTGRVTVRYVVRELLPFVDQGDIDIGAYDGPLPAIATDPHGNDLLVTEVSADGYRAKPITVTGKPTEPGDHVARLEAVT